MRRSKNKRWLWASFLSVLIALGTIFISVLPANAGTNQVSYGAIQLVKATSPSLCLTYTGSDALEWEPCSHPLDAQQYWVSQDVNGNFFAYLAGRPTLCLAGKPVYANVAGVYNCLYGFTAIQGATIYGQGTNYRQVRNLRRNYLTSGTRRAGFAYWQPYGDGWQNLKFTGGWENA